MGKLADMAAQMRIAADKFPGVAAKQKLAHGLMITLKREDGAYTLALGRYNVWPSVSEIAVCDRDFKVPPGLRHTNEVTPATNVYIVRVSWPAERETQLPMIEEEAK